jgi:hypothetical protein
MTGPESSPSRIRRGRLLPGPGTATATDRISSNPLVIRALRVAGPNNRDPVVSQHEAARIHGTRQSNKCGTGNRRPSVVDDELGRGRAGRNTGHSPYP